MLAAELLFDISQDDGRLDALGVIVRVVNVIWRGGSAGALGKREIGVEDDEADYQGQEG